MNTKAEAKRYTESGSFRGLFIFALLAAFALFSLLIVLMGARELNSIQATAEENYSARTALSYLAGKLRGGDDAGMVAVREYDDMRVLTLSGDYDGDIYNTYIYFYENGICEYFGSDAREFDPALGECIIDAAGFECSFEGGLATLAVTDQSGRAHTLHVYLQCADGEGAGG